MNDYSADVRLAQEGSTEAFARLYATVYEDLYHIALYSLRSTHDAADTVSDTVLDAFCSIKKLRSPEKFRSWIMTILAAKIKRKQRSYFEPADELNENTDITESFSFENVELHEAVDNLDNESRLLLSMSVLEGYSSDEISRVCGMKPGTVRSRLARIKQKLRLELTPEI
ncbi:RNA polymerase sigma factor [Ruminococcus flavefaciens]|uniref:RNA polymerase sigma-70 factor, ECF subfamily n=1 Tax=Ruminococcus flavefaciens TaxID=1265 RepID=A0A1M7IP42_RUMFL|nr:sigma-70 family RNA polymerase sigma factor [Ruminococcus flavefaciens]SHM42576.1 RNA polymerase sigma-70 factor, ECF subfamily [Ruminococcus flavefaciens]